MNLYQVHLKLTETFREHEPVMYQTNLQGDFVSGSNKNEKSTHKLKNVGSTTDFINQLSNKRFEKFNETKYSIPL